MGKNKNAAPSAAAAAAEQKAPSTKEQKGQKPTEPSNKGIAVIQLGDLDKLAQTRALAGLDPNHTVDLLKMMHETYRLDPKAAEHVGIAQEAVDKINRITAIGQVAVLTNEIAIAQTPFAVAMRVTQLEAIKEVAPLLGVSIDTKALPAPNEAGMVEVPSSAVKVSNEAKKAAAAEREAAERKVILDPTKIENDQQLNDTLLNLLVKGNGSPNLYAKISATINFYESYLKVQANKQENKDEILKALDEKSRADLFLEIANRLGTCPFSLGGAAQIMYGNTMRTKNPVVAFCMLREASLNEKTGMPQIDDSLVADIVKVLIRWYANVEIEKSNQYIAGAQKNIEVLSKDAKANKKAIEDGKKSIENAKKHIEDVEAVVACANVPDRSIVDSFPENYKDSNAEGYKFARMMGAKILETYYPGTKAKEVDQENLVHNLQQYIGIIFNMFLPAMQRLVDFSEANITELQKKEETPIGEGEGEAKN